MARLSKPTTALVGILCLHLVLAKPVSNEPADDTVRTKRQPTQTCICATVQSNDCCEQAQFRYPPQYDPSGSGFNPQLNPQFGNGGGIGFNPQLGVGGLGNDFRDCACPCPCGQGGFQAAAPLNQAPYLQNFAQGGNQQGMGMPCASCQPGNLGNIGNGINMGGLSNPALNNNCPPCSSQGGVLGNPCPNCASQGGNILGNNLCPPCPSQNFGQGPFDGSQQFNCPNCANNNNFGPIGPGASQQFCPPCPGDQAQNSGFLNGNCPPCSGDIGQGVRGVCANCRGNFDPQRGGVLSQGAGVGPGFGLGGSGGFDDGLPGGSDPITCTCVQVVIKQRKGAGAQMADGQGLIGAQFGPWPQLGQQGGCPGCNGGSPGVQGFYDPDGSGPLGPQRVDGQFMQNGGGIPGLPQPINGANCASPGGCSGGFFDPDGNGPMQPQFAMGSDQKLNCPPCIGPSPSGFDQSRNGIMGQQYNANGCPPCPGQGYYDTMGGGIQNGPLTTGLMPNGNGYQGCPPCADQGQRGFYDPDGPGPMGMQNGCPPCRPSQPFQQVPNTAYNQGNYGSFRSDGFRRRSQG